MLRLSLMLATLLALCFPVGAQSPSPQAAAQAPGKTPPVAVAPAPAMAPLNYQLVPANPAWQPATQYLQVQAVPTAAVYAAPMAAPSRQIVMGPGPISLSLAWVGKQLQALPHQWVITRSPVTSVVMQPVVAQPVVAQPVAPAPAPAAPVFFSASPNPAREAAPPPPIAPSGQAQASIWPPIRPTF